MNKETTITRLKQEIEEVCVKYGLNLTVFGGKIGFVDQSEAKIIALWEPRYTITAGTIEKLPLERFTFDGNFCDIAMCGEIRGGAQCPDGACSQRKVWERLKEYEETRMSPQEIVLGRNAMQSALLNACALQCYRNAEHSGRLFTTPVRVGDPLWAIWWDAVLGEWVVDDEPERVSEVGSMGFFVSSDPEEPEEIDEFHPYEDIGGLYFLSREDAVKAAAEKDEPEDDDPSEEC